jgi:hypothetical protein
MHIAWRNVEYHEAETTSGGTMSTEIRAQSPEHRGDDWGVPLLN